jgi:ArsR family transcriptional regulator
MPTLAPTRQKPATKVAALFHALSDETRVEVLRMLRSGEQCVCELQAELGAAQSRLSFHLRVLKDAGLVTDRRDGRWSYYMINDDTMQVAHDLVRDLASPPQGKARTLRVLGDCCG